MGPRRRITLRRASLADIDASTRSTASVPTFFLS